MKAGKVSVVIPCYNAATTVRETIESALAQQAVSEVIAVDDGSRDDTPDIIRSFGDRVQPVFGPNRGVSAARNSGIELANGEWIQFLDSDDLLYPETLARRLDAVSADQDMVVCDWEEFEDHHGERGVIRSCSLNWPAVQKSPELALSTTEWAPPAAVLYRRDLVARIGGFSRELPVIQDARFLFDAAYHGAKIAHAAHLGAGYRIVSGSLSRRDPSRFWRDVLLNGRQIETLWRSRGELEPAQHDVLVAMFNNAYRGLFASNDAEAMVAAAECGRIGGRSLHPRVTLALCKLIGFAATRRLFSRTI